MSRATEDMHPELRRRYSAFRERCLAYGLDYLLTCTYRSHTEQAELYAQGRTKPGRVVTRALPGESNHNHTINGAPASLAFDIVPLRAGKPVWGARGNGIDSDPTDDDTDDLELWQRFGAIGRACGLKWYGAPDSPFREFPHFELANATEIRKAGAA